MAYMSQSLAAGFFQHPCAQVAARTAQVRSLIAQVGLGLRRLAVPLRRLRSGLRKFGHSGTAGPRNRCRNLVWCISAPYVIIRHLCGAPVLHTLGSSGYSWLCGAILLHTRACSPICVTCGEAALHTFALPCLLRNVWSDTAPHNLQQMSCESCVVHLCSTCQNPTLVWSAGAPRVESRRVFVAVWSDGAERNRGDETPVVPLPRH